MKLGRQAVPRRDMLYSQTHDKVFSFSLITSFLVHILAFVGLFYANMHHPAQKLLKNIEVIYHAEVREEKRKIHKSIREKSVRERPWTPKPKVLVRKDPAYSSVVKGMTKQSVNLKIHKKQLFRIPMLEGKRHISVPLLKSEKITNPKYLNYHDRVRNKIKNRAYFYVDDPQFQAGEVYLTFVLLSNGTLKKIKIIDDKTQANNYLRSVGLRSIKESSPFPAFPLDLKYPELSFHVVISFEVKE